MIHFPDVPAVPPIIENVPTLTPVSVKEHQPPGQFVYRVISNNRRTAVPTIPPPLTYSVTNTDFTIDANTGIKIQVGNFLIDTNMLHSKHFTKVTPITLFCTLHMIHCLGARDELFFKICSSEIVTWLAKSEEQCIINSQIKFKLFKLDITCDKYVTIIIIPFTTCQTVISCRV